MGNPFKPIAAHHFFDWTEVAIALIKAKGIHEGLWRAGVAFENHVMMANMESGHGAPAVKLPGNLVVVAKVDLMQMKPEKADELTVDAAKVNPRSRILTPTGLN